MAFYRVYVAHGFQILAPDLLNASGVASQIPHNFYYLVSRTSCAAVSEVLDYLAAKCLSRGGPRRAVLDLKVSPNTSENYARDLCDFINFLDSRDRRIADIEVDDLFDYVDTMFGKQSSVTSQEFAAATIQRRLSTMRQFLIWCQKEGRLRNRFEIETVVSSSGKEFEILEPTLSPRVYEPIDNKVRYIEHAHCCRLLGALGKAELDDEGVIKSAPRNRLIAESALQAGLRRAEAIGLKVCNIVTYNVANEDPFSTRAIEVLGKGNKKRNVPFPVWLIKAIQNYINTERSHLILHRTLRDPAFVDHGYVFVHGANAPGSQGSHIGLKQINLAFKAARELLVAEMKAESIWNSSQISARASTYVFHGLRHTYAINTYVLRSREGDPNPGKYVQSVLGHSSQATTDALYLRASHVMEAEISMFAHDYFYQLVKRHG